MKILIPALLAALALGGCSNDDDRIAFDGHFYRTKVQKVDRQLDVFTVRVRDVAQSLEGAREAGEYAAIEHCVGLFGSSDIDWAVGPDTPAEALVVENNSFTLAGTCPST
jgi:hypothetical protein